MSTLHTESQPFSADAGGDAFLSWKAALIALGIGVVAILALFGNTGYVIVNTWWTNDAFNHGFFIVPISLYLIWRARHKLALLTPQPTYWGVAGVVLASIGWLLGDVSAVLFIEQVAFIGVLQSFVLAIVGWRVFRAILFPMFFLIFAVPMGGFLIPPLQDFTAIFTVKALQITGIPVFLDGLFIQIPGGAFEVAAACAGARFLITSVTLGTLVARQFYQQTWRRVLFLFLSVAVPIIANGFRAYGLVMIAHLSGFELAVGADHLTFGLIFLSFVIILLLAVGYTFRETKQDDQSGPTEPPAPTGSTQAPARTAFATAALSSVLAVGATVAYASSIANATSQITEVNLEAPSVGAGWTRLPEVRSGWQPRFFGAIDERTWAYANGNQEVDVYTAFYADQRQDTEVIGWQNRFDDGDIWRKTATEDRATALVEGEERDVGRAYISRGLLSQSEQPRVVIYWYWVDGKFTASPQLAKLYEIKSKILGGSRSAAVVAVATNYRDRPAEAMKTMQEFLAETSSLKRMLEHATLLPKPENATAVVKSEVCQGSQPCAE